MRKSFLGFWIFLQDCKMVLVTVLLFVNTEQYHAYVSTK